MANNALPSYPVSVATLPKSGFRLQLEAAVGQRQSVAEHADVEAIHTLGADITVFRWRKDGVRLAGKLTADVEQACVITLEPVVQNIEEELNLLFLPEDSRLARPHEQPNGELLLDPLGEDVPDTFSGGRIDVWQPLIEQLVLAIDPWPRAPGAEQMDIVEQAGADEIERESPFSVLKQLKTDETGRE